MMFDQKWRFYASALHYFQTVYNHETIGMPAFCLSRPKKRKHIFRCYLEMAGRLICNDGTLPNILGVWWWLNQHPNTHVWSNVGWFGMVCMHVYAVFCIFHIFHIFHMHYLGPTSWSAPLPLIITAGNHTQKPHRGQASATWTWPSFEYGKPQW